MTAARPAPASTPAGLDTPPVVDVRDVTRTYVLGASRRADPDLARVHALRGVTFRVEEGEFLTIVGPSGSGKSTLLHLLGALDRPSSGSVSFFGRDVAELSDAELAVLRNRDVGFVFQQFQLLARTTAEANVALPLIYRGTPRVQRREQARAALDAVGLGHRRDHRPAQLSGGEQQRVAIARALVTNPRLILADEPTGNLDTVTGKEIMAVLQRLNHEQRRALIVITHDPELAALAPRRLSIRDGEVVADTGGHGSG